MVANNNVKLEIRASEGITYSIDRRLDAEFGKDITLKGSTWNSIMDVVKADQATTNPQYSGGNTDINNGKHFIVNQGVYEITQNAWNQIITIAQKALGISPAKEEEKVATTNTETKVATTEDVKTKVSNLLEKVNVSNLDEATLNEVVKKYSQIMEKEPNTSDEMMALRLRNFVNGKINAQKMAKWDKDTNAVMSTLIESNIQNPDVTKALRDSKDSNDTIDLSADANNISTDKLTALSNSYMEFQDLDNSKDIDIKEYYQKDLIKYYQSFDNLSLDEAKAKAEETLNNLNITSPDDLMKLAANIDITSDTITPEEMVLSNSVMQFVKLNRNSTDNKLDITEIMAYHAAVANFDTQDNKLDIADYNEFNEAILSGEKMTVDGKKVEAVDYFLDGYYNALKNK